MPKIDLSEDDISELIDLLEAEIERVEFLMREVQKNGPSYVEFDHRARCLKQILQTLEDA